MIAVTSSCTRKSFVARAWDLQHRIEDGYKTRKERIRKKRRAKVANSKLVMDIRSVKRFRKAYAIEACIGLAIPSFVTVFFFNFLMTNVVGGYILVGGGAFFLGHFFLMLTMDYAIYKRTNGKEDWFFSKMDDVKEL